MLPSSSSREHEIHGDLRLYFYRFTVQEIWSITPLADCVNRGFHQKRVAADHLQVLDPSFTADHCLQDDLACGCSNFGAGPCEGGGPIISGRIRWKDGKPSGYKSGIISSAPASSVCMQQEISVVHSRCERLAQVASTGESANMMSSG
jgi:hypothetical protein